MQAQDIEIYLHGVPIKPLEHWLQTHLDKITLKAQHGKPPHHKKTQYQATWQANTFSIIVMHNVADGFSSLWLNHTILPWQDDAHGAQSLLNFLQQHDAQALATARLRYPMGGWQEQQDTHEWVELTQHGQSIIVW